MDFNVYDNSGTWVGIVEAPTSAIWTRRWNKPNDFELYFPASEEALELLEDDFFITREDAEEVMLIEHIEIITDEENGNYMLISGRGVECILERRIIWNQTTVSGRVDACMHQLVFENVIYPDDPDRAMTLIMYAPTVTTETMKAQYTGKNLLATVEEVCAAHGLGFRAVADFTYGYLVPRLELMKGTDRSEGQTATSPVVFSAEYENLLSSSYVMDTSGFKNVALVAGEGEGKARKRATYGRASGMARREVYVDARDMSTNDGEISDADYAVQLEARGAEALAENALMESFDGEISTDNTFVLNEDYFLGDVVTVENEYGIRKDSRIASIMESWDETGHQTVPTFENVEV